MFEIYRRNQKEIFNSKKEAISFYKRCSKHVSGAEYETYEEILDALEESDNDKLVMYDYNKTKITLKYNKEEDYLEAI